MTQKKVYFDFNVFVYLANGKINISDDILKKSDIFISVAHVEEYYKAYKNDEGMKNVEFLKNLKKTMITKKKQGIILNPTSKGNSNKIIDNKPQAFEDCYKIVERYDTRQCIENIGEFLNEKEKKNIDKLRKNNPNLTHISNFNKKEIWNIAEVIEEIQKFPEYVVKYNKLLEEFNQRYRIERKVLSNFSLEKDCFKKENIDFDTLECIIEFMSNLLSRCGFYRDKNPKKTASGIHDVSHLIYATYCEYLVSFDCRFRKRAEAIYYFLGIDTRVLSFEEFINEIKDN